LVVANAQRELRDLPPYCGKLATAKKIRIHSNHASKTSSTPIRHSRPHYKKSRAWTRLWLRVIIAAMGVDMSVFARVFPSWLPGQDCGRTNRQASGKAAVFRKAMSLLVTYPPAQYQHRMVLP